MNIAIIYFMKNSLINYYGLGSSLLSDFFNADASSIVDAATSSYKFKTDIDETEQEYTITAAVPGLSKKDIKVEVLGDKITIEGSRKINDRMNSEIRREFAIYSDVNPDAASATVKDGILTITLPKKAKKRNLIQIK